MKPVNIPSILLSIVLFTGCLATSVKTDTDRPINVETIYTNSNCSNNQKEPSSIWITSQEQFSLSWKSLQSRRIGENRRVVPQLNFAVYNVLLINMGMRKSGGYGLELAETSAHVNEKTATIYINWIEPEAGAFVIQMLTSPCLLLKLERGDYQMIQVRDQSGKLRITSRKP